MRKTLHAFLRLGGGMGKYILALIYSYNFPYSAQSAVCCIFDHGIAVYSDAIAFIRTDTKTDL